MANISKKKNLKDILGNGNDADGNKIENLGAPTSDSDAATKEYVDTQMGDVQPYSEELTEIAELTPADGDIIQRVSGSWLNRTVAQLKTALGLTKSDVGLGSVDNVQQLPMSYLDTDPALTADSDTKVPSQKAVKAYADSLIAAADAMRYKGATDCSSNPIYPTALLGDTYRVSVAGKIGGASGATVQVGDMFICLFDTAGGDQATVGANWNIIQANIDGAVLGPSSSTDNAIARFDGATGKLIQSSGASIDDSGNITATNLSGTNTGDQTTIVGITGTKSEYNTSVTDGNFLFVGDVAAPAGSTWEVMFNDDGVMAGSADFRYDKGAKDIIIVGKYKGKFLSLADTNDTHYLNISAGSDITADRELTIVTGDSNRTLTMTGNATISGTNTGDQSLTGLVPYTGATGSVTLGVNNLTLGQLIASGSVNAPNAKAISGINGFAIQSFGGTVQARFGVNANNVILEYPTTIDNTATDYHTITGGTGTVFHAATGASTNININLTPKGTGRVQAGGTNIPTVSSTDTLTNKTLTNTPETTQTLTDAATVTWNMNNGGFATLTLGGNRTIDAPTNLKAGGSYLLILKQDGSAPRTVTWNSIFKWAGGTAPTLSTGNNDVDILSFISDGTNLYGSIVKDFS